jgi:hypothetical protein
MTTEFLLLLSRDLGIASVLYFRDDCSSNVYYYVVREEIPSSAIMKLFYSHMISFVYGSSL